MFVKYPSFHERTRLINDIMNFRTKNLKKYLKSNLNSGPNLFQAKSPTRQVLETKIGKRCIYETSIRQTE